MRCIALGLLCLTGLVGCATSSAPTSVVDEAKMAAVERAATRAGVKIIWVNVPRKEVPASGG
jgi:hypothetical protein